MDPSLTLIGTLLTGISSEVVVTNGSSRTRVRALCTGARAALVSVRATFKMHWYFLHFYPYFIYNFSFFIASFETLYRKFGYMTSSLETMLSSMYQQWMIKLWTSGAVILMLNDVFCCKTDIKITRSHILQISSSVLSPEFIFQFLNPSLQRQEKEVLDVQPTWLWQWALAWQYWLARGLLHSLMSRHLLSVPSPTHLTTWNIHF